MKLHEKNFTQNVERWATFYPKEATLLPYVDREPSQQESLKGIREWFYKLTLEGKELLVVYGLGAGACFIEARSWLESDPRRMLVFLEDEIEVIAKAFETAIGSDIMQHSQVELHYFKDLAQSRDVFNRLSWAFLEVPYLFSHFQKEYWKEVQQQFAYDIAFKKALVDEYLKHGLPFFINYYQNLFHLSSSYLGDAFFGQFKGVPAIICGAGPSLNKQLGQLKELRESALIFAGGSAFNACVSGGVDPHFGVAVDPNTALVGTIEKTQPHHSPFFYRGRAHFQALPLIQGPKLFVTGAGGYDVAAYFEKALGLVGSDLDEGHNVVNFSVQLAKAMGCDPIIFVGLDLAYTDQKSYAEGVVEDVTVDLEKEDVIERLDIEGNPVWTLWKWVIEAEWLATFAEENPNLRLINATEGGIGMRGIPNQPLKEIVEQKKDLEERIKKVLAGAKLQVTGEQVAGAMQELVASLERSIAHLDVMLKDPESGLAVLSETELEEEVAYPAVLQVFNTLYTHLLQQRYSRAKRLGSEDTQALKQEKLQFLKQVAISNRDLLRHVIDVAANR